VLAFHNEATDPRFGAYEKIQRDVEVVYVVSPDRQAQLFRSLGSLFSSGTHFDLVRICCIGMRPPGWCFTDRRVSVEVLNPLFGEYFYGNKLYLCETVARTVVFLDADTVVLGPLEMLWRGVNADFFARPGSSMTLPAWKREVWHNLFREIDRDPIPMFNTGVLVFKNGAHLRVRASWRASLLRFLDAELPWPYPDGRQFEQWSLAMALAQEQIPFAELRSKDHAFGWCMEPVEGTVVFHYGNCVPYVCASSRCRWLR
jgi:hypothetical protein